MVEKTSNHIEPVSLVDRLVSEIRDAIVAGSLEAGSHIGVKRLADEYGVSMIPVREALARMQASRLVEMKPNRGYFVASKPTPGEFSQFVQAREMFERSAVDLGFDNATSEDIQTLRRLNDMMRKAAKVGKKDRMIKWGQLNSEFHQTLVGLARNTYIDRLYSDLSFGNLHFQLVRSYPREFTSLETLIEQHEDMIAALEKGDKEQLLSALSGHIRNISLDV